MAGLQRPDAVARRLTAGEKGLAQALGVPTLAAGPPCPPDLAR